MKPTTQAAAEIIEAYKKFWVANLSANMEDFATHLVDNFSIIGTANGETFFSRKDAVAFYAATADELKDKAELRNRSISMQPVQEDIVIVHEQSDLYVLMGNDWSFYGHARISCLMQKINSEWKAVHQHASFPDHRTEEGQQLATQQIEKENLDLKEAVERRTVELKQKNRELEIEAALERIRAVAMGMTSTNDLLEISKTQFIELQQLGFEALRNSLIGIFHTDKDYLTDYDYSDLCGGNSSIIPLNASKSIERAVTQMKLSTNSFTEYSISGEELAEWKTFREQSGEYNDPRIKDATILYYYFYSINNGAVGISTFERITAEQVEILKKFRNVFDLAYKRYVDISNAEAQAREAQIEIALERIRSRSMAMHKSEELKAVIQVVFEQFVYVNIPVEHTGFIIDYKERDDMHIWLADQYASPFEICIPYFDSPHWNSFIAAKENGMQLFTNLLDFEQKNKFYQDLFTLIPPLPEKSQQELFDKPGMAISTVLLDNVGLYIENFSAIPFTEEDNNTLIRFAKVFEQTYTRFLDLQKAEAQARETKVEMALEKVRSRTMAMQHSRELADTASVLFEQIKDLGFETWSCGFCTWLPGDLTELWMGADSGGLLPPMLIPYTEELTHHDIYKASLTRVQSHQKIWEGENLEQHYRFLKTIPSVKEAIDVLEASGLKMPVKQCYYAGFFEQGYLLLITKEPDNELKDLSIRFAKVFEQTYTRFLDLQKAEAQAREAKIELALEKVRARTMAMQSSDELREAVLVINEQLQQLGFESKACNIILIDKDSDGAQYWVSGFTKDTYPVSYHVPKLEHPYYDALLKPWKHGEKYVVYKYEGEGKKSFDKIFFTETDFKKVPEASKNAMLILPSITLSTAYFANGALQVLGPEAIPEEKVIILQRFAKVFEQTYTRFLDLQKAEAQARESQVEAALEKVRSRTMAMQHSDELLETATQLFRQIEALGAPAWNCSFNIWQEDKKRASAWNGTKKGFGRPFTTNSAENVFSRFFEADQKGEELYVEEIGGPALKQHYDYLATVPGVGQTLKEFKEAGIELPLYQVFNIAYFSQGYLMFITYEPVPQLWDVFKRFAKVFEQTYTRFLDLQKAEAQTRAAQIELAVERVRAKALAMHNSAQIGDVVETLRHEMLALEIPGVVAASIYLQEEDGYIRMWDLSSVKQLEDGFHVSLDVKFKLEETNPGLFIRRVWNNKDNYFVEKQEPHDMVVTLDWLRQYNQEQADEVEQYLATTGWDYLLHPTIQLAHGKMSVDIFNMAPPDEMESIMVKMGAAFDLAYKRFIDLQKSEQQNREAQIELALERVRTVAMTMSKPEDLLNISEVLFKALQGLNFADLRNSIIHKYDDAHQYFFDYDYSDFTGGSINRIPFTGNAIIEKFISDIQHSNKAFSETAIEGERLGLWRSFRDHNNELPDERLNKATALYYYFYSIGEASIGISTFTPITTLQQETLRRFRNVFDLAYQRYVDITKAAAQTREAQIELSLERIRAKVTAMKVSSDLLDIVVTMRTEFVALGHEAHYFWHMRWQPDLYEKAMTSGDGSRIGNVMTLPRHIHGDIPLIANWENSDEPSVVYAMDAEAAVDYVIKMIELGDFQQVDPNAPTLDDIRHIGGLTFIMARTTHGEIGYSLPGPVENPPADGVATLVRFAAVFDLAYRRFEDLKSSEKQIREAQIELSLERVRARSLAMHKSEELGELSLELVKQVQGLGVSTWFCAFNIHNENDQSSLEWGSNGIGTFPTYSTPREHVFLKYYEAGQKGESFLINEIGETECPAHYEYLCSLPGIGDQLLAMKAAGIPFPAFQIDHVAFMKYGYLLFITYEPVPEAYDIFIRFAKVFEQTYTRFLDLQKAEALAAKADVDLVLLKEEKKRTEEALNELQVTQKQLIQSEKMASLGELTAGIAHEIQNPLNFVNNFSEVSKELLDEMKAAIEKGDTEEAKEIMQDVIQNLEKINLHGKRADGIVKGMLQHSTSGSGKKEPTDINALAEEYLRLSYQGYRAKDKSFNAVVKIDFDPSIGEIEIVPQDMGRVLLNLLTNAFYTVNEKKYSGRESYEPTVSISTKKVNDQVEIRVSDNGNGIPGNAIEKIFQPFFTTKPTGKGTGLGLSLAYDIVNKAHGGELKVDSISKQGTTFIISIPIQC